MNIDKLIQACKRYPRAPYEKELNELLALKDKMTKSDTYGDGDGEVFCISLIDCMDVVNVHLYDVYGLIKKSTGECTFEQFKAEARRPINTFCTMDFTDAMLHCGYDLISDLWSDNEADGMSHNPNGTFKKTTTVTCPDCYNDVPKGAYCMDCGCDLSWDEQDIRKDDTDETENT